MGKIVEKKKKKKGRPSLLDIQKRNLREQQQNQRQTNPFPNSNSNPNFTNSPNSDPNRRFTRQNLKLDEITKSSDSIVAGEDDEFDSNGKKKENKLQKVVLKVNSQRSSLNSPSLNSQFSSNGSDSIAEGDNSLKKRKINAIDGRSVYEDTQKELSAVHQGLKLALFLNNLKLDEITKSSDSIVAGEDDEFDSNGKKKENKLQKVVLKVNSQRSSLNSPSLNSQFSSNGSDSIAEGDNSLKKRKINAIDGRSVYEDTQKEEEHSFVSKSTDTPLDMAMECVPTTPLPDKKLLVFILDRLQKKDTYRVFSEPVDPKELPDYHDIVENPMDFATVRKKLSSGVYANLEQFENDVFLICSNAMIYNSSDTIYFRQARSIQELAKRDFDNLRQESDDNGSHPKVIRRGRPPTKNLKKRLGRPPIERAGSGLSSDVTLANAGDKNIGSYDLRRGPPDSETFAWSAFEANDEFPASVLKGISTKFGKKHYVLDENRRNTYKQSQTNGRSQSVLATFDGEKKQLMAVGLHMEHGFARSLARFAATLGPIAWRIASKKIERALPAGVKFGPGWVGENETPSSQSSLPVRVAGHLLPQQQSLPSSSSTVPTILDVKVERSSERQDPSNNSASGNNINRINSQSIVASSSSSLVRTSSEPTIGSKDPTGGLASESGVSFFSRNNDGIRHNPSFQIKQGPVLNPSMNGFIGGFQNPASKMDNLVRPILPDHETVGINNKLVEPMSNTHIESEDTELSGCSNTIRSDCSLVGPGGKAQAGTGMGLRQSSWQESSEQQKSDDSVPPDLNVRFQSPGSPTSTQQPDLALQL
ncbi:Bromodomain-containing protein [Thalictrum thalictroides]|uniref:Bromodomain-containing protein n=1 Tax=Thalictrum thalictroides TaxID=46969 RepID=A0A7J6W5A2_THATH|nr:Bromodomain-containing protein [Thalictrum thalictroides]